MGFAISAIGSDSGRVYHGETVKVTGTDFGASPGSVKIDGVAQTILSWTDTEITFTVDAPTVGTKTLAIDRAA